MQYITNLTILPDLDESVFNLYMETDTPILDQWVDVTLTEEEVILHGKQDIYKVSNELYTKVLTTPFAWVRDQNNQIAKGYPKDTVLQDTVRFTCQTKTYTFDPRQVDDSIEVQLLNLLYPPEVVKYLSVEESLIKAYDLLLILHTVKDLGERTGLLSLLLGHCPSTSIDIALLASKGLLETTSVEQPKLTQYGLDALQNLRIWFESDPPPNTQRAIHFSPTKRKQSIETLQDALTRINKD